MTTAHGWELWRRDVETGEPLSMITGDLTEYEVARALTVTGGRSEELFRYAVSDGVLTIPAEDWLDKHPVANLRAVWRAGTARAAEVRHHELRSWWPALAFAIARVDRDQDVNTPVPELIPPFRIYRKGSQDLLVLSAGDPAIWQTQMSRSALVEVLTKGATAAELVDMEVQDANGVRVSPEAFLTDAVIRRAVEAQRRRNAKA